MTGPVTHEEHLHPPLLYYPGMALCPDCLYIGEGHQFDSGLIPPGRCCVISIGEPPEQYLRSQACCILVDTPFSPGQLLNRVQAIFEVFCQWELRLDALIQHNSGIQEILNESQPFFEGNFFLVLDVNYRVLATTSEHNYVMDQNGFTPSSVLTRFKKDPEYSRMRYHRETFLYRGLYFDHDILTHHIFINDELSGTFSLAEKESPLTDGRWTLFEHLARMVNRFYQQRFYLLHSAALQPTAVFSQLLDGEIVSMPDLARSLKGIGWDSEDTYLISFVSIHEADKKIRSAAYLCHQLESLLPYSLALEHGADIAVILNSSKAVLKAGLSLQAFSDYLSESMLQAGISRPFRNLMQLKNYYQQARAAIEVGRAVSPGQPVYHFADHLLDYMLNNIPGAVEGDSLCPDGLLALRELDQQRGSAYLQTLDTFFRTGCNATQSARALYINRSTFLERMTRIKKLLDLDLDDYDTRLYLMLCLRLLSA